MCTFIWNQCSFLLKLCSSTPGHAQTCIKNDACVKEDMTQHVCVSAQSVIIYQSSKYTQSRQQELHYNCSMTMEEKLESTIREKFSVTIQVMWFNWVYCLLQGRHSVQPVIWEWRLVWQLNKEQGSSLHTSHLLPEPSQTRELLSC